MADRVRIATHLAAAESRVHVDGTRGAHGAPHAATCGSTLEWTANDFRGSAGEATGDDDGVAAPGEPPPPQPPPSPPPAATSPVSMAPSADGAPASSFDEAVSWQSSAAAAWRAEGGGGGGKLALLPGGDGGGCAYALPEDLLRAGAAARAKYSGGVCGEPTVHGVPPMPSVDAALGSEYARPTRAWESRLRSESPEPEPAAGGTQSLRRSGPPSCLTRAAEPYREKRVEYVGVAHARIRYEEDDEEAAAAAETRRGNSGNRSRSLSPPRGGTRSAPCTPRAAACGSASSSASSARLAASRRGLATCNGRSSGGAAARGGRPPWGVGCSSRSGGGGARNVASVPTAALGVRRPVPSDRSVPTPQGAAAVLGMDGYAHVDVVAGDAALQVAGVIRSVEDELGELNRQYIDAVAMLRAPGASGQEEAVHARLRTLVLQLEQKSAQLGALRRTHTSLTESLGGVRDELLRTRSALQEAVDTAKTRWQRIQKLEKEHQAPLRASGSARAR